MPAPALNSTSTTFQLGTYNALTDTFTTVLDLNDSTWFRIRADGLDIGSMPPKIQNRAANIRTPGEVISKEQYKNRHIKATVWLRPGGTSPGSGTSAVTTALLGRIRILEGILNNPPFVIRIALPGGTAYSYADVRATTHNITAKTQEIIAGAISTIEIDFECYPYFRGDRQWLQNLVCNPGFEAPAGLGVMVFNDTFASASAYSVQTGSALIGDFSGLPTIILPDGPLRYYRLNEASGTTAVDGSRFGQHGTINGGVTLSQPGALNGDSDTCMSFNGSTGYISTPSTGLPTGNTPWTLECWVNLAVLPAATHFFKLMAFGGQNTNNTRPAITVDSSGALRAEVWGNTTSGYAITTGGWHHVAATWDGTTLTLYVDGTSRATATPGALNVPSTNGLNLGADVTGVIADYLNGSLDECAIYGTALSAARVLAHYNAGHNAPAAIANAYRIPTGGRVTFGSPNWGAVNQWQVRFRWLPNAVCSFYLHYTDANNNLAAQVTQGTLSLIHTVGGTAHTLGSAMLSSGSYLQFATAYWLAVTQFPALAGAPAPVQATLLSDSSGAVGSSLLTVGPVATYDAVTALSGAPQIATSGAPLPLGGAYANVHYVNLFGPGGWLFVAQQGTATAPAVGAWDGSRPEWGVSGTGASNTFPNGPVTSFGAARFDLPPTGTVDSYWHLYGGGTPTGTNALPVPTAGDVLSASAWVRSAGLSGTATIALELREYDASGTQLRATTLQQATGNQSAWVQLAGSVTTGASCAYAGLRVRVAEPTAGASANGTVWIDNVLCWDQTQTGMTSMPYCELRFPLAPAQLMVSGILGDAPAPAHTSLGTFLGSWGAGATLRYYIGRRAVASANSRMVSPAVDNIGGASTVWKLDASSYGGYYLYNTNATWWPLVYGGHASDQLGTYHLLQRALSAQSNTYISKVLFAVNGFTAGAVVDLWNTNYIYEQYLPAGVAVFSAQNTWTVADGGQITLPYAPRGALGDTGQWNVDVTSNFNDQSGQAVQPYQAGWSMLLPVDGELIIGGIYSAINGGPNITNQYMWAYFDGLNTAQQQSVARTFSLENTAIPQPARGLGTAPGKIDATGSMINGTLAIGNTGHSYMTVDPSVTINGTSVNQFGALLCTTIGNVVPLYAEFRYSPLYLYPH